MIYRLLFKFVVQWIPAEAAHALAARSLRAVNAIPGCGRLLRRALSPHDARLQVKAFGLTFPSPLGVAGGMDKNATWFDALGALGFGFVEVGTVTAQKQPGSPRPRVWRLTKDRALLNSMGFPNAGCDATAKRLHKRSGQTIVGVSVGKSRVVDVDHAGDDYRACTRRLVPVSDFIVLNMSSPNTPDLRALQEAAPLRALIADVRSELRNLGARVPLLVKISPDLQDDEIDKIAELALALELDGIVATNTTVQRSGLRSDQAILNNPGGVSGAPLKGRALEVLRRLRAVVGDRVVLVSVGGIENADDAWERIRAGATLIQAHTGFVYGGPLWPRQINEGLLERMRGDGASSIQESIGASSGYAPTDERRANGYEPTALPGSGARQVPSGVAATVSGDRMSSN